MRLALLSDIHGNLVALDAVLSDMARQGSFDHMLVAGDLVWSGPWPAEVVDRVCALNAVVIQGNTDAFFASSPHEPPEGKHEDRFAAQLAWMRDRLGPRRVSYLLNLPFSHRFSPAPGQDLLAVHANPIDMDRALEPKAPDAHLDELLSESAVADGWAALAFGHLHVPFTRRWRDRLLVNVASAGLPMDGDVRAVYTILTWDRHGWRAEHHRVFYSVPIVAHQMRTSGMPRGKHFAERLVAATYSRPAFAMAE